MKVYNIQAVKPFLLTLAKGLFDRFVLNQISIPHIKIFLPSKRLCNEFEIIFLRLIKNDATLLPQILPLGDLNTDEIMLEDLKSSTSNKYSNKPISQLKQQVILASLTKKYDISNTNLQYLIAKELSTLNDILYRDSINISQLSNIIDELTNQDKQEIANCLNILLTHYPKYLKSSGEISLVAYINHLIDAQCRILKSSNNNYPVIIAGSTGSIKNTRRLIKIIANLPNGYVILPGFDYNIDIASYNNITDAHPQFMLKKLCHYLGVKRIDIKEWYGDLVLSDKEKFFTEVFRPVATSHMWKVNKLKIKPISDLHIIECERISQEVRVIELIIRHALEQNIKNIMVVSNNKQIFDRILQTRYNIEICNVHGYYLEKTTQFLLIDAVAKMIESNFSPQYVLAVLKNRHVCLTKDKKKHDELVYQIERIIYRKVVNNIDINSIITMLPEEEACFFQKFYSLTKNLIRISKQDQIKFVQILTEHIQLVEALINNSEEFYNDEAGKILHKFITDLISYNSLIGFVSFADYIALLSYYIKDQIVNCNNVSTACINLFTPIEARGMNADLVILADVNEESWPKKQDHYRLLSRNMQQKIGIRSGDEFIGQSAHDFFQLISNKKVYILRSKYKEGSYTIESRWITRLYALANYWQIDHCLIADKPFVEWSELIVNTLEKCQISPPQIIIKNPVISELSATKIEMLINNPYVFYLQNILNLKPLDDIDREPRNADFGNIVHNMLDQLTKSPINQNKLHIIIANNLKNYTNYYIYNFWYHRLYRIAKWFYRYKKDIIKKHTIYSEIPGHIFCNNIKIKAKADCIYFNTQHAITIVDYKTGKLPLLKDIQLFNAPQLLVEALIAKNYGFQKINSNMLSSLKYILLKGNDDDYKIVNILEGDNLEDNINRFMQYLHYLTKTYNQKDVLYKVAYSEEKYSDHYLHIARFSEWADLIKN